MLACAEQHLETCQLAIGPHKKSGVPGEGKENLAYRKAVPLIPETDEHLASASDHGLQSADEINDSSKGQR